MNKNHLVNKQNSFVGISTLKLRSQSRLFLQHEAPKKNTMGR